MSRLSRHMKRSAQAAASGRRLRNPRAVMQRYQAEKELMAELRYREDQIREFQTR